jgi:hypothetical protein
MNVSELVTHVNHITDEDFDLTTVMGFLNDGLAAINVECKATFPFLTSDNDIPVLPESWQRMLLVPYAAARIKQNDSSQFEYMDLYAQFENALRSFKMNFTIPEEYKETTNAPSQQDFTENWYRW